MSRRRERPRLVAARVLAVGIVLVVGILIGALAADRSPAELSTPATAQLKRAALVSDQHANQLSAELRRVRAKREEALERSRSLKRANSRLRRELRQSQRARRSRSR